MSSCCLQLVQHYAHTYTVKVYSDMLRWWPPPSAGNTTPHIKQTPLKEGVYLVMHTLLYFGSPFNTEPIMSLLPCTFI